MFKTEIIDVPKPIRSVHLSHYDNVFKPDSEFPVGIISGLWNIGSAGRLAKKCPIKPFDKVIPGLRNVSL
jgi:hypothetical protein